MGIVEAGAGWLLGNLVKDLASGGVIESLESPHVTVINSHGPQEPRCYRAGTTRWQLTAGAWHSAFSTGDTRFLADLLDSDGPPSYQAVMTTLGLNEPGGRTGPRYAAALALLALALDVDRVAGLLERHEPELLLRKACQHVDYGPLRGDPFEGL